MGKLLEEIQWFLRQKIYVLCLTLTAVLSYGFEIVHPIIGIDDTAVELYLKDGLEVVMGRWTLFLLNKIFYIAEFAPFMLELIGVLFFMLGVTLFCVLIKRCMDGVVQLDIRAYTVFACVFISNPIISEVFIYYYHNGSGMAYALIALALLAFYEVVHRQDKKLPFAVLSMLLLWVASGCYESFLILYILGVIVLLFGYGIAHPERLRGLFVPKLLGVGALLVTGSVLLRAITIPLLTKLFSLQGMTELKAQRSLTEMSVLFDGKAGLETLWMLMKRFYVVYYVNAVCYLPVTGYVAAVFILGAGAVYFVVKKKNVWYPILWVGMLTAPFLLTLAEASVTLYRSCQYLPFFAAVGALFFYVFLAGRKRAGKIWRGAALALMLVVVYRQATEMNRDFYLDYLKYEHTRTVLTQVAHDVESRYGTEKPIVFTGYYDVPYEFLKDYYVGYGSKEFQWVVRLTDPIDPHLKEKYYTPYGYSFVGEAHYPFIEWGFDAFDGTNRQMIRFLEMHGHTFQTITDLDILQKAREIGDTMPRWPAEGSITEQEAYILIHM